MVLIPSIIAALQLGSGMIQIGKAVGSAIRKENPRLAFKLGTSVGYLTASAEEAQRLLRRVKESGQESPILIREAESLLHKILRSLNTFVRLLLRILFKPGVLERILGRLKRRS
jgi:hypothetical protein